MTTTRPSPLSDVTVRRIGGLLGIAIVMPIFTIQMGYWFLVAIKEAVVMTWKGAAKQ